VGGVSRTNDVPYIYVLSFLKNDKVQQPVMLPDINENQIPWHLHIFNIHANIQKNTRLFIQKLWEELAGQMVYPIWNTYSHFSKMTRFNNL
jgi:hypothetical protein